MAEEGTGKIAHRARYRQPPSDARYSAQPSSFTNTCQSQLGPSAPPPLIGQGHPRLGDTVPSAAIWCWVNVAEHPHFAQHTQALGPAGVFNGRQVPGVLRPKVVLGSLGIVV